jgi:hypothetical protein
VDVVVQDGARGAIGAQEIAVEEIEAEEQQLQNTANGRAVKGAQPVRNARRSPIIPWCVH